MPFAARFIAPIKDKRPHVRGYIYDSPGAPVLDIFGTFENAVLYLDKQIEDHKHIVEGAVYLIPFVWGYKTDGKKVKIVEINGYCDIPVDHRWPEGNAEKRSWVIVDGEYKSDMRGIGCEESDRVIAKEVSHRKNTRTFEEFMETSPHLGELEPPRDFRIRDGKLVYVHM